MRHVFVLNPMAGKNKQALTLRGKIDAYFANHPDLQYAVHLTDCVGAATRIAREECEKGDAVRLYACGGDGTLQEVANGLPVCCDRVELAVIPCGSGNDYVRMFGGKEAFEDIASIVEGSAYPVDAVDCGDRISLNIASIGLDASVALKMQNYKNLPGVSGSAAYNMAIVDVILHPIGEAMEIEITGPDGIVRRSGRYLMAVAANGRYYGGGYCGAPQALENDGVLDFVLVRKISRLQIPGVLKKYKVGAHDNVPCIEHISGTEMKVRTAKAVVNNVDGECYVQDSMHFSVIPRAFSLVLPDAVARERYGRVGAANAVAL